MNAQSSPIRILLADVHAISRSSSRAMLDALPGLVVVGETSDHSEALAMAKSLLPDVVLISMRVHDSSGPGTARALLQALPKTKVIFFTLFDEPEYVRAAADAGAHGYVFKHEPAQQIYNAIVAVMDGGTYFSPGLLPG